MKEISVLIVLCMCLSITKMANAVEAGYIPRGDHWKLGNMTIYETPNKTFNRVLICAYDIFGFHNNTKQVADLIAEKHGFIVAMPDFFRTSPFDINNYPPKDSNQLAPFTHARGVWEDYVRADVIDVINYYKLNYNITEFGVYGFCWGGKIALRASVDIPDFKAAALIHPSLWTTEEAREVNTPMYLLPSRGEGNMLPFYVILQEKFGRDCGHRRFDDMGHGFASALGNFGAPLNSLRVDEVIDIVGQFLAKYM